ncbi:hypothetical protein CHARACLAT_006315 [Characodon lateralis]|uniref:Transposase n=1 Tax=Characodon lateralis TaxID=208331 RepID=A0ABU7CLB8_9TELE|nr:hypothetical protein [Characodon lateralis]
MLTLKERQSFKGQLGEFVNNYYSRTIHIRFAKKPKKLQQVLFGVCHKPSRRHNIPVDGALVKWDQESDWGKLHPSKSCKVKTTADHKEDKGPSNNWGKKITSIIPEAFGKIFSGLTGQLRNLLEAGYQVYKLNEPFRKRTSAIGHGGGSIMVRGCFAPSGSRQLTT